MLSEMNEPVMLKALKLLALKVDYHAPIELLLVGGAAGVLTGVLRADRTTTDCDIMVYEPTAAMAAVELAAQQVAQELDLNPDWLNSNVQIRVDSLPTGWRQRRILIHEQGSLRLFAASKSDLIAMKVLAGRDQDLEDIHDMQMNADDKRFVQAYLSELAAKGTSQEQIENAKALLMILPVHES